MSSFTFPPPPILYLLHLITIPFSSYTIRIHICIVYTILPQIYAGNFSLSGRLSRIKGGIMAGTKKTTEKGGGEVKGHV